MMRLVAFSALLVASGATARTPPVVTGSNTGRETSQPVATTGSGWGSANQVEPSDQAFDSGRRLATCAVQKHPRDVAAALNTRDRAAFARAVDKFDATLSDCMFATNGDEFAFQPSALAGLLAEAWINHMATPSFAPAKYNPNAPQLDWLASSPATLVQLRLGECLATTQPSLVRAFVTAKPGSSGEDGALGALVPAIPTCLDKNVTLQAKRNQLRVALAYALYWRGMNPVPPAQEHAR